MTALPIINREIVITQSGHVWGVYADYNFAADECHRLAKQYPWYTWQVMTKTINPTVARVKSGA